MWSGVPIVVSLHKSICGARQNMHLFIQFHSSFINRKATDDFFFFPCASHGMGINNYQTDTGSVEIRGQS